MTAVPNRLRVAVEALDVQPNDRVLEIGGGTTVAAELVCARLGENGFLLGLDRSAKAVAAATTRHRAAVDAGRASFRQQALEAVEPAAHEPFDKVFAVNVNLFWTRPAQNELSLVAELLAPGGALWLFFEPPDRDRLASLEDQLASRLDAAGYAWTATTSPPGLVLGVRAVPRAPVVRPAADR